MATKYRLRANAGMHRLGRERDEDGHPVFIQPGEVVTSGEEVPERVLEAFSDKWEKVQVTPSGQVVTADGETSYDREALEDKTKAVLRHIAHQELGLSEEDIGTKHSETETPVKEDYIDAILSYQ